MQTDPVDDATLIDGTGSLVTYLIVSGTIDAFAFKGDGSQLENLPSSSLPNGLVSSSVQLGLSPSDSPTFANLTVDGTLTAQEFYTEYVSASIIYESGSTKFGDTFDDVHSFTGSLQVDGSITGSLFGTASNADFSTTSSYIDPLFISASVVALGLSGASEWDEVQNKPVGLVSSSAQTIGNLTGTNIVSGSGQRDVLGLGESDSPRFGNIYSTNGNFDGNVVVGGTLTARTYIISSSVIDYQTIQISGSTKFGDTLDDTHQFTGSIDVLGSITGSLQGSASYALTASYALNAGVAPIDSSSFATTGSNTFEGNQQVNGWIEATDYIITDNVLYTNAIEENSTNGGITFFAGGPGFAFNTNVEVTGSLVVSGSTIFGHGLSDIHQFTGSVDITGSLIINGTPFDLDSLNAFTASQEITNENVNNDINTLYDSKLNTSSFNDLTSSFATTGSNTFIGDQTITGSLFISGSLIVPESSLPQNAIVGSIAISGSDLWIYM